MVRPGGIGRDRLAVFLAVLVLVSVSVTSGLAGDPAAGATIRAGDPVTTEWETSALAWGRPDEQRDHPALPGSARARADALAGTLASDDRTFFAGRPRLTLFRIAPIVLLGDPWRDEWAGRTGGTHVRVHFLNRDRALLTGDLWGPAPGVCTSAHSCPGVVVTEGGDGASARMYWWIAQALAEAGYVVLTYDVQGQGESETFGHDASGFLACVPPSEDPGLPELLQEHGGCAGDPSEPADFAWGAIDAHNWFASAADPWSGVLDTDHVGAVGHSFGADAVSVLQSLPAGPGDLVHVPVRAVAAYDWLTACGVDVAEHGSPCPAGVPLLAARVPALDVEGDYLYWPVPRLFPQPDPGERLEAFRHWTAAGGIDVAALVLRGATHYDFSSFWWGLPASAEGQSVTAAWTVAFFDAELRGLASGRERLLARSVDATHVDPLGGRTSERLAVSDLLSVAVRSAVHVGAVTCEDWQAGC